MDRALLESHCLAMTTAMVLCAGLGTRLRPLTRELPKPLMPLGDRPVLSHIVSRLKLAGVRRVVLNVHQWEVEFTKLYRSLPIIPEVISELAIRGTAGGIAGARQALGSAPIVVHTGDILTEPPVRSLLGTVDDGLCLAVQRRTLGEGPLGLGEQGQIVRLRGEVFGREHQGADYVGVAALGARCLASLPDWGCLMQDWALPELRAGRLIKTVNSSAPWTDIGGLPWYLAANLAWLGTRAYHVADTAVVAAGVALERSIIGTGASVYGSGLLKECVVWPGARIAAPLSRSVVTTGGLVVPVGDA